MINFSIYNYDYDKRIGELVKEATGVVKSKKIFPIYEENGKKYLFKPLSKTKPWTTPLFAYSEVFWSNIINEYFDKTAPIYRLAKCNGYEEAYPNRYSKGTIVESVLQEGEHLVDLLKYFKVNKDPNVNIDDYINYCGIYYDYTDILNSKVFRDNSNLGKALSRQILISILKNDLNFHYENLAFICRGKKIVSLAPPMDHEFSEPFVFPDDYKRHSVYFSTLIELLITGKSEDSSYNKKAILNNINIICEQYPDLVEEFLKQLKLFLEDYSKIELFIAKDDGYMEPCATDLFQVYEGIYKDHNGINGTKKLEDINLVNIDMTKFAKDTQSEIIFIGIYLYNYLSKTLNQKKEEKNIKIKAKENTNN